MQPHDFAVRSNRGKGEATEGPSTVSHQDVRVDGIWFMDVTLE